MKKFLSGFKDTLVLPSEVFKYFFFSLILFFLFGALGFVVANMELVKVNEYIEVFVKNLENISEMSVLGILLFIFLNNSVVAFLASIGGIVLSIFTILIIIANGFLLGIVLYVVIVVESLGFFLLGVIPHGVIEIPAVLFAAAIGMWLGKNLFNYLIFKRGTKKEMQDKVKRAFCTYIFVIIPLLFLAALIEVFITPVLLNIVFDISIDLNRL